MLCSHSGFKSSNPTTVVDVVAELTTNPSPRGGIHSLTRFKIEVVLIVVSVLLVSTDRGSDFPVRGVRVCLDLLKHVITSDRESANLSQRDSPT